MKKRFYLVVTFSLLLAFFGLDSLNLEAATLTGKAFFQGTPSEPKRIRMDADPKCAALYLRRPFHLQEVVAGKDGELASVFIYIKSGLEGKRFEAPKEAVVLDQKDCWYAPRVFGIQVNQTLEVLNSDSTTHNVNATPEFNSAMPPVLKKITKKFTKPHLMLTIRCNVHPWMSAYAGVLEHPFYSVSKEDGTFEIANLPAGRYVVEAWHERLGTMAQEITVAEDESKEIKFSFRE
jgi:plastocyanin